MTRHTIEVGGGSLEVSNLDRVMYPASGMTKADVLSYYLEVSTAMLPHLRGRPVTLLRHPDGVEGEGFYQKRCPEHRPRWLSTISTGEGGQREHCRLDDAASLLWAANLGALEFHVPLGHVPDLETPASVVFDLDPGPPADILDCAWLALRLREVFDAIGLVACPKTSGSKGLQVYVPLNLGAASYAATREFALSVATLLERREPDRVVTRQARAARPDRILIDWLQNHRAKTTVCAYSLRARDRALVSTPTTWSEVEDAVATGDAERLRFEPEEVIARIERHGDLFADVDSLTQELPSVPG